MTKILFVDDDAIARRSILTRIDWEAYGWELVYTARDGVDALEYMKNNQPDIVLSDIKMPVMDGIQMAVIAKDYYPHLKFVFLSGYKEFEYAKKALQLNAVDYLNKPVEMNQLVEVLKKAERLYYDSLEADSVIKEKYPLIKRQYISKLMYENFKETNDTVFRAFDINLTNGLGIVGFIDYKYKGEIGKKELKRRIQELCVQLTREYEGSFFLEMDNLQIFMIFTMEQRKDETALWNQVSHLEIKVNEYLEEQLDTKGIFYYGTVMHELNDLYQSYQKALQEKNSEVCQLLHEVKHYLECSYSNPDLTLLQIANQFGVNHSYLTSMYKDKFGVNLYDYLIQIRMEKAGELFRTSSMKSYEVAEAVGYHNSQYFSSCFKKYFECTVTQYKKSMTEEAEAPEL